MSIPNPIRMDIKVATLNLCLGLQAKKNIVKETIINEKIDILSMQETEINPNLNHNLLSFPGYAVEIENNSKCARVAFYISTRVNYIRRRDLEGNDSNIIIIDMEGEKNGDSSMCIGALHHNTMYHNEISLSTI